MRKKIKNKKQFTLIELIIVIVVIGILAAMAMPKFIGVQRNAHVAAMEQDLDVIEKAVMQYVMATDDGSYPFVDTNGDTKINEEDLYFKTNPIPQTLTDTLLKANGDDGSKIYKLDMDKLKPYIDKLKYPNTDYVYSPNSDTAIDPIGKPDGDNNIHHIIGGGIISDSSEVKKTFTYEVFPFEETCLYLSTLDNSLTFYEDYSSKSMPPLQKGEKIISDDYAYIFRNDKTIDCISWFGNIYKVDLTALEENGETFNLEKDLMEHTGSGFTLLTEKGNVYVIHELNYGTEAKAVAFTDYSAEIKQSKTKKLSTYSRYSILQTDNAIYLFTVSSEKEISYKVEIPGGITTKDKVVSSGRYAYVIKEDGTIYYVTDEVGSKERITTVDTSVIIGGIDINTDTFYNCGENMYCLKENGDLYLFRKSICSKVDTSKLSKKLNAQNLKLFSSDYENSILVDKTNGQVITLHVTEITEQDVYYKEGEDIIKKGGYSCLFLVKKDGKIYTINDQGEFGLMTDLSIKKINFDTTKDNIQFYEFNSFSIAKENGELYIWSYFGGIRKLK